MATAGDGVGVSLRVAKVTLSNWAKGELEDHTTQVLPFWAALKARGQAKFGLSGGEHHWPFRDKTLGLTPYADGAQIQFQRHEDVDDARVPFRMQIAVDAMTKQELLQNKGEEAIVKLFEGRKEKLKQVLAEEQGRQWHLSGNSVLRFHGIESFMGATGQTDADFLATTPNSTYATKSCAYTTFGASGTPEYGLFSPVLVNCNRNPGAGSREWADFCNEYMRRGIVEADRGAGKKLDAYFLNKDAYLDFLNLMETKERLNVQRGSGMAIAKLGFETVQFDGVEVIRDDGVPTTDGTYPIRGYGYNFGQVEYLSLLPALFGVEEGDKIEQLSKLLVFYTYGNLKFQSPRYFVGLKDLAA